MGNMLEAKDIQCTRGERLLFKGVSFALHGGDLLHLGGANGSGKTSLLRTLCGLSRLQGGSILWCGEDIRDLREDYCAQVVYIGHQAGVKDDLTTTENLCFSSALAGVPISQDEANAALSMVGLEDYIDRPARALSQGQKRRVALARLWVSRSPLWILDEPFTALDKKACAQLKERIESFLAGIGMVILTTHQEIDINASSVQHVRLDA